MEEKTYTTKKKLIIEYREEAGEAVEKRCTACRCWRSIHEFLKLKGAFLGRHNHCNVCEAKRAELIRRSKGIAPQVKPIVVVQDQQTSRNCSKCKLVKILDEFDLAPSGFLGHDSECKECKKKRSELSRRSKGIPPQRKVPILTDAQGTPTHRECSRCERMLPLEQYAKHGGGTAYLGIHPYCKTCAAEKHLISKYGLTSADKAKMHQEQSGACLICQNQFALDEIHVDHCHSTGKVRGLLCSACNKALGLLKDNHESCRRMAEYLLQGAR